MSEWNEAIQKMQDSPMTATLPSKPASAQGADWSYAFDSDTLRDRFGGSFMATEPDENGNVAVLLSTADAHAIIHALAAAPEPAASPPSPGEVRIKPLEWNEYETEGEIDRWDAQTVMGAYYEIGVDFNGYLVSHDYAHLNRAYATLDEAKAAAQADYESRIRASLAIDATANSKAGDEDVRGALAKAVAGEREACARIAEGQHGVAGVHIAADIRARTLATPETERDNG